MADLRLELVHEDARAAIDRQARKLDELRARAAAVLTAAAVGGGFLGSKAVTPPLRGAALVGVVLSVITGLLAAVVLLPLPGWVFSRNPNDLLASYVDEPSARDITRTNRSTFQRRSVRSRP